MSSAKLEWRANWPLPLVAMVGITGGSMSAYSLGVFVEPMTKEFGWTRTEFFSVMSLQMLAGLFLSPVVGRMVDKFGSRRLALMGCFLATTCFSLYGLATDNLMLWYALGAVQLLGSIWITQPVWLAPVARTFETSRGLAMAVALSGNGMATAIWPPLAAIGLVTFGWRLTFPVLALCWVAVTLPLALLFFDRKATSGTALATTKSIEPTVATDMPPLLPLLLSPRFLLLTASGCLFSGPAFGLSSQMVPMMSEQGLSTTAAASIAALAGVMAIVGRLGTGLLLDLFPTRLIAVSVFIMPIIVAFLLPMAGANMVFGIMGAIILGLAAGAEVDVVAYIAARQFDRRAFGTLFATALGFFGVAASMGPVAASMVYDTYGNYDMYFQGIIVCFLLGMIMIWFATKPERRLAVEMDTQI